MSKRSRSFDGAEEHAVFLSRLAQKKKAAPSLPLEVWFVVFDYFGVWSRFAPFSVLRFVCKSFHAAVHRYGASRGRDVKFLSNQDCINEEAIEGNLRVVEWAFENIWFFRHSNSRPEVGAAKNGHVEVLEWLLNRGIGRDVDACAAATREGKMEVVDWLRQKGCPWTNETAAGAARSGNLELLKRMAKEGNAIWDRNVAYSAARSGRLEVLEWVIAQGCPWDGVSATAASCGDLTMLAGAIVTQQSRKLIVDASFLDIARAASRHGKLEVLLWLQRTGDRYAREAIDSTDVVREALTHGRADILRLLVDTVSPGVLESAIINFLDKAIQRSSLGGEVGSLGVLKVVSEMDWWWSNGAWTAEHCHLAAMSGFFDVLRWLRETFDCPWDARVFRTSYSEIAEWAFLNGCPTDDESDACFGFATRGDLEGLQRVRDMGCPWHEKTCHAAASSGRFKTLVWARENGCPWDSKTTDAAIERNDVEMLRWLLDRDCPVSIDKTDLECFSMDICRLLYEKGIIDGRSLFDEAVIRGWITILELLEKSGYTSIVVVDDDDDDGGRYYHCRLAAKSGKLDTLEWLRRKEFDWDVETCVYAIEEGHLNVLKWAKANGCPWNSEYYMFRFKIFFERKTSDKAFCHLLQQIYEWLKREATGDLVVTCNDEIVI